jgi:hypothetical protein
MVPALIAQPVLLFAQLLLVEMEEDQLAVALDLLMDSVLMITIKQFVTPKLVNAKIHAEETATVATNVLLNLESMLIMEPTATVMELAQTAKLLVAQLFLTVLTAVLRMDLLISLFQPLVLLVNDNVIQMVFVTILSPVLKTVTAVMLLILDPVAAILDLRSALTVKLEVLVNLAMLTMMLQPVELLMEVKLLDKSIASNPPVVALVLATATTTALEPKEPTACSMVSAWIADLMLTAKVETDGMGITMEKLCVILAPRGVLRPVLATMIVLHRLQIA